MYYYLEINSKEEENKLIKKDKIVIETSCTLTNLGISRIYLKGIIKHNRI